MQHIMYFWITVFTVGYGVLDIVILFPKLLLTSLVTTTKCLKATLSVLHAYYMPYTYL